MTRFLMFIGLFPGIAVAVLIAFISPGASLPVTVLVELAGWGYAVGVIPALICAAVDLYLRRTRIPPVIGTAVAGYAMAALVFPVISDTSDIGMALSFGIMPLAALLMPIESATVALSLAFGLVGGISAAVCSWLAGRPGKPELMAAELGQAR